MRLLNDLAWHPINELLVECGELIPPEVAERWGNHAKISASGGVYRQAIYGKRQLIDRRLRQIGAVKDGEGWECQYRFESIKTTRRGTTGEIELLLRADHAWHPLGEIVKRFGAEISETVAVTTARHNQASPDLSYEAMVARGRRIRVATMLRELGAERKGSGSDAWYRLPD